MDKGGLNTVIEMHNTSYLLSRSLFYKQIIARIYASLHEFEIDLFYESLSSQTVTTTTTTKQLFAQRRTHHFSAKKLAPI